MNKRKAILAAALAGLISAGVTLQTSTASAAGETFPSVEAKKPGKKKKGKKKDRKEKKRHRAEKKAADKNSCGGKNGCGGHMHEESTPDTDLENF